MGKGSKAPPTPPNQQVTQTTSNLPEYAQPYFENLLQRGQAESYRQYQPYEAERLAGFTPNQLATQQETMGMQTPGQFGLGTGMVGSGGLSSLGAGQQFFGMAADPNIQQAFMSPYQQSVTDVAKKSAIRDAQMAQQQINLGAVRQGTYGGARQTLAQGERERGLLDRLSGLQAEGSQKAFEDARRVQQFGSDLGLRGIGQGIQAGQTLGQLGQAQQEADLRRLTAQESVGGQQRGFEQQKLDQQYADFLRQRDFPMEQLGYFSNLLRGLPMTMGSTQTTYAPPPSMVSQIGGLGLAGLGLAGAARTAGFAEGGEVDGPYILQEPKDIAMEYGGNKQKIEQAAKMGLIDPTSAVMAGMFIDRMRNAQQEEMALEQTVAQETFPQMAGLGATPQMAQMAQMAQMVPQMMPTEAGVAALPLSEDTFTAAEGGMIAFDDGGPVARFDEGGSTSPFQRFIGYDPEATERRREENRLRNQLRQQYGRAAGPFGFFVQQSEEERAQAQDILGRINTMSPDELKAAIAQIPAKPDAAKPVATTPTTPAAAPVVPAGTTPETGALVQTATQADDFASYLSQIQGAMPGGKALEGLEKDITADREARKAEKSQAGYMSLAIAGLNVAAGTSPFALVNLGKGLSEGLKNYADELKGQKKLDREDRKMLADINKARRDEERGNVTAAMASYEKALDRVNATDRQRLSYAASIYGSDTALKAAEIKARDPLAAFFASRGGDPEAMKRLEGLIEKASKLP